MELTDQEKAKAAQDARQILGKELAPVDVVDKEAWEEYTKLRNHPLLNERKTVTFSDGRTMRLGAATFRVKKIVENLPDAERQRIMLLHKMYHNILCRSNAKMQKAYGSIIDRKGNVKYTDNRFGLVEKELVELFGRMFTIKEVHQLVLREFKIPCSTDAIRTFRERHQNEINTKIEDHKRTYSDIRLGYKRSRLEELTYLYSVRRRIYEVTKKGEDHRLLLFTLEQIRKEIEGDSLRIDGALNVNIEQTVNQHINQELFVNFPLKEIIIARVAARLRIGSEKLLTEIEKGYYAGYIGAKNAEDAVMPMYPSLQTYDFDRIKRINVQAETNKELEKGQVSVISPDVEKKALTVKEMLLQKLKHKSDTVNHTRNKLQSAFVDQANKTK